MRGLGMFDPPLSLRAATRKPTAVYQFWWEARRDEPGREGTLQHAGQIKLCNSDCNQNRAIIWNLGQLVTTPASQSAWWQVPARRSTAAGRGSRIRGLPDLFKHINGSTAERVSVVSYDPRLCACLAAELGATRFASRFFRGRAVRSDASSIFSAGES